MQSIKMKVLFLFLATYILSCTIKPKKPFVITGKYLNDYGNENASRYYYIDANGNQNQFTDLPNKYSVGDTIK